MCGLDVCWLPSNVWCVDEKNQHAEQMSHIRILRTFYMFLSGVTSTKVDPHHAKDSSEKFQYFSTYKVSQKLEGMEQFPL